MNRLGLDSLDNNRLGLKANFFAFYTKVGGGGTTVTTDVNNNRKKPGVDDTSGNRTDDVQTPDLSQRGQGRLENGMETQGMLGRGRVTTNNVNNLQIALNKADGYQNNNGGVVQFERGSLEDSLTHLEYGTSQFGGQRLNADLVSQHIDPATGTLSADLQAGVTYSILQQGAGNSDAYVNADKYEGIVRDQIGEGGLAEVKAAVEARGFNWDQSVNQDKDDFKMAVNAELLKRGGDLVPTLTNKGKEALNSPDFQAKMDRATADIVGLASGQTNAMSLSDITYKEAKNGGDAGNTNGNRTKIGNTNGNRTGIPMGPGGNNAYSNILGSIFADANSNYFSSPGQFGSQAFVNGPTTGIQADMAGGGNDFASVLMNFLSSYLGIDFSNFGGGRAGAGTPMRTGNTNGNRTKVGNTNGNRTKVGNTNGNRTKVGNTNGNRTKVGNTNGNRTKVGNTNGNRTKVGNTNGNRTKIDVGNTNGNRTEINVEKNVAKAGGGASY